MAAWAVEAVVAVEATVVAGDRATKVTLACPSEERVCNGLSPARLRDVNPVYSMFKFLDPAGTDHLGYSLSGSGSTVAMQLVWST
jgi:hypothetical protein